MGFATADLTIHYLRRARSEVFARARILKKGRRVNVGEVDIVDASGRAVARVLGTFILTTSSFDYAPERTTRHDGRHGSVPRGRDRGGGRKPSARRRGGAGGTRRAISRLPRPTSAGRRPRSARSAPRPARAPPPQPSAAVVGRRAADATAVDQRLSLFIDFENIALGVRDAQYKKFDITSSSSGSSRRAGSSSRRRTPTGRATPSTSGSFTRPPSS
jgi:hypothetical protein